MAPKHASHLDSKALRSLGVDTRRKPEGMTLQFRQQAQRDGGGRRWRWSMDALKDEYQFLFRMISPN